MAVPSTSQVYSHLGNAANVVFRVYDRVLRKIVPLEAGIYKQIPDIKDLRGNGIGDAYYFKIIDGYNESGVGTRAYDAAVPTARRTTFLEGSITERALYAAIKVDLRSIARMKGAGSPVGDLGVFEVELAAKVAAKELARMVYCDGTGIIATAGVAGTTVTALTVVKTGGPRASGALYIRKNVMLDSYTSGGAQEIDSESVSAVDPGAATDAITLGTTATWTGSSLIYREDSYIAAATNDWEGLEKLHDDGTISSTYAGITVSSNPGWAGIIDTAGSNRAFDPEILEKVLIRQRLNSGQKVRGLKILSNLGQPAMYWKYTMPAFHVNVGAQGPKFDLGVADAQPYKGIPWQTDVNCPFGRIYIPDFEYTGKFEMKPFGPPAYGLGNQGWTWDATNRTDAAETYRAMYGNFVCKRRDTSVIIKALTEEFLI